jgi:hypothetical protein
LRVGVERGGARGATRAELGGGSPTAVNHGGRREEEEPAAGRAVLGFRGEGKEMRPREREEGKKGGRRGGVFLRPHWPSQRPTAW